MVASNFKHSGTRVAITSASGIIASGALVYQEGFVGVAVASVASGKPLTVVLAGTYNLPVPVTTVKGDPLYADLSVESVALALTKTAGGNYLVGIAETARDSVTLKADVNIEPYQGGTITAISRSERVTLTETTGAGTYTGSVTVPALALITDIKVWSTVLWNATTSATMIVGDAADPNGWFAAINLEATDLLVGEEINFNTTGGKEGAYLVPATGARAAAYSASQRVISAEVITVGAAGSAGRSFMEVLFEVPSTITAATKA